MKTLNSRLPIVAIGLSIGLLFFTPTKLQAQAIVNDPMANVSLLSQLAQMIETVTTLSSQLTTLTDIKDVNFEDLLTTMDIFDTLGVAPGASEALGGVSDFFGELFSLASSVGNFDINGMFGELLGPLANVGDLMGFRMDQLFSSFGGMAGSPLEKLQGMSADQMKNYGSDPISTVAGLWNQKTVTGAEQNVKDIENFDKRARQLSQQAESAEDLQQQTAVGNQLGILKADQQTKDLAMQQEAAVGQAAYRESDLQIRREEQVRRAASTILSNIRR